MDDRLFFPATQRNKSVISNVLSNYLPQKGFVLEIASGSGEHAVFFQQMFPNIIWQASDPNPSYRKSINGWIKYQKLQKTMPEAIDLNVLKDPWPLSSKCISNLNSIVCINMLHISHFDCTRALFKYSEELLSSNSLIIIYGPFKIKREHISKSNLIFDKSLRDQNSSWGVRDLGEVERVANKYGFAMNEAIQMPSNNFTVVFALK